MTDSCAPTLYYFDIPGPAEVTRWCFKIGNVPFNDVRFSKEEWESKYKAMSPTGQAPFLEVNGRKFGQSAAIMLYAAKKANLLPACPERLMTCMMHHQMTMEALSAIEPMVHEMDEAKRADMKAKLMPTFVEKLKDFDAKVAGLKGNHPYCAGDQLTFGDVWIASVYRILSDSSTPLYYPDLANHAPHCKQIHDIVIAHPNLEEYLKSH